MEINSVLFSLYLKSFLYHINPLTAPYRTAARIRVEAHVSKLNQEEKGIFLDDFSNHPVLISINSVGIDSSERVKKFLDLNDDDLDLMIKMQVSKFIYFIIIFSTCFFFPFRFFNYSSLLRR